MIIRDTKFPQSAKISADSVRASALFSMSDSGCNKTNLFNRKTTAKSEDILQFVVRKRLLGETGRKQSENLHCGTVESDRSLGVDLNTVQCFVKHQEKEAPNHKTPDSKKSGRPGISHQTGKERKK